MEKSRAVQTYSFTQSSQGSISSSLRSTGGRRTVMTFSTPSRAPLESSKNKENTIKKSEADDNGVKNYFTTVGLNREKLRKGCERLKPYINYNKFNDSLPPNVQRDFEEVMELAIAAYRSEESYKEAVEIIGQVFGSLSKVKEETIGEWFRGCYIHNGYGGNPACSAECAGNLPALHSAQGLCDTHVAVYKNSRLTLHHSPSIDHDTVLIHVKDKYCTLSRDDVKDLKNKGIHKAIISSYNHEDGKYTQAERSVSVHLLCPELRSKNDNSSSNRSKDKNGKDKCTNSKDIGGWALGFIVVLLFIIIILAVIWCMCRRYSNYSQDHVNYTRHHHYGTAPQSMGLL